MLGVLEAAGAFGTTAALDLDTAPERLSLRELWWAQRLKELPNSSRCLELRKTRTESFENFLVLRFLSAKFYQSFGVAEGTTSGGRIFQDCSCTGYRCGIRA